MSIVLTFCACWGVSYVIFPKAFRNKESIQALFQYEESIFNITARYL